MNVAREGVPFIVIAAIITVGLFVLALAVRSWGLWLLAIIAHVLSLWGAYILRFRVRDGPRGAALVIAPADGRVVMITNVEEPAFLGGTALRISIFMSVFNVHVNRYPVDGVVRYLHYNPGKFLNAASDKASLENEQMSVGIQSGASRVLVRQIAGLIARRIVSYATMDAPAAQGERMGIIRFGSRVDVFLPPESHVRTQVGDHSVAGTSVLAELPA
jgi:phosphatidylserine decarboxylase